MESLDSSHHLVVALGGRRHSLALQGVAVLLMSPWASETVGLLVEHYWLLLCGTLIYLLGYGCRALLVLRKDPRSRRVANIYLVASGAGIAACVVRFVTAYIPALQTMRPAACSCGVFACMCGAGFAFTSAESWRNKTKWFIGANR